MWQVPYTRLDLVWGEEKNDVAPERLVTLPPPERLVTLPPPPECLVTLAPPPPPERPVTLPPPPERPVTLPPPPDCLVTLPPPDCLVTLPSPERPVTLPPPPERFSPEGWYSLLVWIPICLGSLCLLTVLHFYLHPTLDPLVRQRFAHLQTTYLRPTRFHVSTFLHWLAAFRAPKNKTTAARER